MIPIQDLINRIKWDEEFKRGEFKIGYYDRFKKDIIYVSFSEIDFVPENHFLFEMTDAQGEVHTIPLHRVRRVYKNEKLIWERRAQEILEECVVEDEDEIL
ncbi:hypothetical protein PM10SUCC1_04760 [Propionigenium maris DSM 9537]|uniref:MJ1316 RNA cyclic group end recognition domain-containing protein n=1 Tax=Propionigenium maris DSM 9537 TaxID=1123000 RepID=A0A9W6LL54_9FUSO|nr:DUF504 domain-containing protein [Propionigenium maris]GLI54961.1 hypothetical protein PM10SUCC1_04760 [Propionigenium maris DSM 9537]